MKNLILFLFILFSHQAVSSPMVFRLYKQKIKFLEDSIIQDFSMDYPKKRKEIAPHEFSKMSQQVEVRYEIQKKLFLKIESELFRLQHSISKAFAAGKLSKAESSELTSGIEYASRIILRSRKEEINQTYTEFKNLLVHTPSLNTMKSQLSDLNTPNCALSNINFNKIANELSFNVKKKNKFGGWTSGKFKITQHDMALGHLVSQPETFSIHKIVTRFWTGEGDSQKHFVLYQNSQGNILKATFHQTEKKPLVKILGISFGKQIVKKQINCISKNQFTSQIEGPMPASNYEN